MTRLMEAIAAAVTGLLSLAGLYVRHRLRRKDAAPRAVRDYVNVYDLLVSLRHEVGARRVVVVKTHNGGGIPSARTPLYSTALYEVTGEDVAPIKGDWVGLPVDETYARLLQDMLAGQRVRVDPSALGPSALSDVYSTAEVRTVLKLYLSHDSTALYYLSIQWAEPDHEMTAHQRLAVRSAVVQVRHALAP